MAKKVNTVAFSALEASEIGKPRVDFRQDEFDVAIQQKGYTAVHEKALRCPCMTTNNREANPMCKNCGGTGYIFISPTRTRFVIQSMSNTKNRGEMSEWDGSFQVTTRTSDGITLAYMDRITVEDSFSEFSEVVHTNQVSVGGETRHVAFIVYPPEELVDVYKYDGAEKPLIKVAIEDIEIPSFGRLLYFPSSGAYSMRYKHKLQMIVKSILRDVRDSKVLGIDGDVQKRFPQLATAVRTHQQFDDMPYVGDGLYDNT